MHKRALTHGQRSWLLDEIKLWQKQSLLSTDQADRILDLYEAPHDSAARQRNTAIFVLMGVAAFLVGLAVLLLIGYNWDVLPAAVKLFIIFGVLFATYAGAFYLRYSARLDTLSEVVFFLGCLFYGAAIWLIAQIFHLNAHYPDGFWWWALGILPFALCLDTLLLHLLLVAVLAIWVGTEVLGFAHLGMWLFGRWGFLPNGAWTLPLLAVPGLAWAYRKNSPFTAGLYVALFAWWVVLQPFAWMLEGNPIFFIGSVGSLLLILAEIHREGSPFAIPYRLYGVLLALGALIPLSYYDIYDDFSRSEAGLSYLGQMLAIVILAGVVLTMSVIVKWRREASDLPLSRPVQTFFARQWLPLGLLCLLVLMGLWEAGCTVLQLPRPAMLVPTVLANLAMLAAAYWLVALGLREDRSRPFAAGVGYFLLWAVLRYIDLFGGFGGMLGAAAMFLLCGAALFGVALFWRRRRKETTHV